jgi:ADP-ribose pyrophosphatase YjhB (NUDIX family)
MRLEASGIVVNELGQVLLVRQSHRAPWALPTAHIRPGEPPADGARRAIEETAGLAVLPARLTGLYYWSDQERGHCHFVFRCLIQRGGHGQQARKGLVGYAPTHQLPPVMAPLHRERLQRGLVHAGGFADWLAQALPLGSRLSLRVRSMLPGASRAGSEPGGSWPETASDRPVAVFAVLTDSQGRALWLPAEDNGRWRLPGGVAPDRIAPWEWLSTLTRQVVGREVRLGDLSGVYPASPDGRLSLVFKAQYESQERPGAESGAGSWVAAGQEPEGSVAEQVEWVAWANRALDTTFFGQGGAEPDASDRPEAGSGS